MLRPQRQMTYYVVTFPDFYSYENNRVVIKKPRSSYYSYIHAYNNLLSVGISESFYQAAISPAVCLEPSFLGKQESLMYLVYLESQGMPVEYNRFAFPYKAIFQDPNTATDFSRNLQLAYTEAFRQEILQAVLAETQRRDVLQEIHNEVASMGSEIAKETLQDLIKDFIKEYQKEGIISFDPRTIFFTVAKVTLKVIFKKALEKI